MKYMILFLGVALVLLFFISMIIQPNVPFAPLYEKMDFIGGWTLIGIYEVLNRLDKLAK